MKTRSALLFSSLLASFFGFPSVGSPAEGDWLMWRGPNRNGIADSSARPPSEWGEKRNVRWRAEIPGRGLSSPVVSGDLVVLTTAVEDSQRVLAYDRASGRLRWEAIVHEGGLPEKLHRKNSAATSTVASDGESFFALFHNKGRLVVTALDRGGRRVWQRDVGGFTCGYKFGYAASPTIYRDSLIVSSEYEQGFLVALHLKDGAEKWRTPRKVKTTYSSPIVGEVAGREQLLLSGTEMVTSFDPETGRELWKVAGGSPVTCGTLVWSDDLVFSSGGFPNKETLAVRADGSGGVAWKNGDKSYEQSLLYHEGHVYTLNDNGIAVCWDAETGGEKWKVRLGGPVSASPILANGLIYATNERGIVHVFKPDPDSFQKVAEFQLGDEGFATPVFVAGEVFVRTAEQGRERREYLYCVAAGDRQAAEEVASEGEAEADVP